MTDIETGTDAVVLQWEHHVFRAMERVKARRGVPLHRRLPYSESRWNNPTCGREGCPCSHGKYGESQGDFCDRGLVPTRSGALGHCPTCQHHARTRQEAT